MKKSMRPHLTRLPQVPIPAMTGDRTPLHIAAFRGRVEEIRALIDAGARAELQDAGGNNAFHLACYPGSPDVPDSGNADDAQTELLRNKVETVRLLAERLDPSVLDAKNRRGENGFLVAVKSNFGSAVDALLDLSSPVITAKYIKYNMTDNNGDNAFTFCCRSGQKDMIFDSIVPNSVRFAMDPARGVENGLVLAVQKGHVELVGDLLSAPQLGFLNVPDRNKNTPFHIACQLDSEPMVRTFLEHLDVVDVLARNRAKKLPRDLCGDRNRGWIEKETRIYESGFAGLLDPNLATLNPVTFLGEGTFGKAYECTWQGQTMVLKIPQPAQLNRANFQQKLIREIKTWAVACRKEDGQWHENGQWSRMDSAQHIQMMLTPSRSSPDCQILRHLHAYSQSSRKRRRHVELPLGYPSGFQLPRALPPSSPRRCQRNGAYPRRCQGGSR